MAIFRHEISKVFTPRAATVNEKMYMSRGYLEKALSDSISGTMHALLIGESGNGKSWLYKTVFERNKIPHVVVNCANAVQLNSLAAAMLSVVIKPGTPLKVSMVETMSAGVNAVVADGSLESASSYDLQTSEPIQRAFAALSKKNSGRRSVIVFENLEAIFANPRLMEELANAIILLDDESYSRHNIFFLIVGTPTEVLKYFEKSPNLESVSNRIRELPRVGSLDGRTSGEFITKGFREFLNLQVSDDDLNWMCGEIFRVTMGVAQRLHELCEAVAIRFRDNGWRFSRELLEKAEIDWLAMGLRDSYITVESHLNSRRTEIARRNQVIYSIGCLEGHQFDSRDVEAALRASFPETVRESGMGIGGILSELCDGERPLISRAGKTGQYRVRDPRYLMCIRAVLRKDSAGKVSLTKLKLT